MCNVMTFMFSPSFLNVTVNYATEMTGGRKKKKVLEEIKLCPFNSHAESYFQVRHGKHFEKEVN